PFDLLPYRPSLWKYETHNGSGSDKKCPDCHYKRPESHHQRTQHTAAVVNREKREIVETGNVGDKEHKRRHIVSQRRAKCTEGKGGSVRKRGRKKPASFRRRTSTLMHTHMLDGDKLTRKYVQFVTRQLHRNVQAGILLLNSIAASTTTTPLSLGHRQNCWVCWRMAELQLRSCAVVCRGIGSGRLAGNRSLVLGGRDTKIGQLKANLPKVRTSPHALGVFLG
ncbi:unnamed protein product, partial [Ectocarpus sp. 12 AP-2014]